MDIFEAIEKRHSYRDSFLDKEISRDDLIKIVNAGISAPSGKNAQTTEFVIIDEPSLVKEIAAMHDVNKAFQQAKAFIACIINKQPIPVYEGLAFEVEDCSAAAENMLLAITAMGYASVWIDGWIRREDRNEKIGKIIGLSHDKVIRIILPLGVPANEIKYPPKKNFEERAWFNSYKRF